MADAPERPRAPGDRNGVQIPDRALSGAAAVGHGEGPALEDQHHRESSPEVLVSNGEIEAAIEAKAMIGSQVDQTPRC